MKWFIPPIPRLLSRTHAETQEPNTVKITSSSQVT